MELTIRSEINGNYCNLHTFNEDDYKDVKNIYEELNETNEAVHNT
jgi:hypothetical protein